MRHDHTDWLIHFVRDRVRDPMPEQYFSHKSVEIDFCISGELEYGASAFTVLKTIIRLGGLIPGYSVRSGRSTVYGGYPVICATEMPLYSFAMYARDRADSGKVSPYGIAFLKSEFYAAGGRPAIYGLSVENISYTENDAYCRIIDPRFLPIEEQYRYVAYNPSTPKWIDWSHEREWRWKVNNSERDYLRCRDRNGCYDSVGGLPLFRGVNDNGFFSKLRVIVWNREEARQIQELLTGFYLAGYNDYDMPFDKKLIFNSRIIILEDVISAVDQMGDIDSQTIEGLEEINLVNSIILPPTPMDAYELVSQAFIAASTAGENAAAAYLNKYPHDRGTCGFAHAITYEVTNPIVQYMIKNGWADGPFDGKVCINIKGNWPFQQTIDYHECIYQTISDTLTKMLGINILMESQLD